jgi:hypothetical protein
MGCEVFGKKPGAPVDAGIRLASRCLLRAHPLLASGVLECSDIFIR